MKRISPIRTNAKDPGSLKELKQDLRNIQNELADAYTAFDYANDPDLTEASIFAIRSLRSRMNYLVRQIKEQESCVAAPGGRRARWV